MPTEITLKTSLNAKFVDTNWGMDEKDHVDLCCHSLHKCDAHKQIELNHTIDSYIRNCDCVNSFQKCLTNSNTSLSNELALIHSINTTKCYAKDHPIIKCKTFETYPESKTYPFNRLINSTERERFLNRCLKYDLDQSQPPKLQKFDMALNEHATPLIDGEFSIYNIFVSFAFKFQTCDISLFKIYIKTNFISSR